MGEIHNSPTLTAYIRKRLNEREIKGWISGAKTENNTYLLRDVFLSQK